MISLFLASKTSSPLRLGVFRRGLANESRKAKDTMQNKGSMPSTGDANSTLSAPFPPPTLFPISTHYYSSPRPYTSHVLCSPCHILTPAQSFICAISYVGFFCADSLFIYVYIDIYDVIYTEFHHFSVRSY